MTKTEDRLISHATTEINVQDLIYEITERIKKEGDKPYATIERQIAILKDLTQFSLGLFLLQNKGLNGFWTHFLLTYNPTNKNEKSYINSTEQFMLERAPVALATRQRYGFFLKENQLAVGSHKNLACIPSGMMGELLYLDFKDAVDIKLFGIDLDPDTLKDAKGLAEERKLSHLIELICGDAWQLTFENEFDLISSNGLTIYEPNNEKVRDLYAIFFKALKPGGKLVTSFLTYPPNFPDKCEWNLEKMNRDDLMLQKVIFVDIIGAKWQCFRTTEETKVQLESVGFQKIEFTNDDYKQFPTVVAEKPSSLKI
ncbi:MAG: class I SAM-dependent methyltransferase [Gammaproteobacteria bacterium]|nr:class I SAM-dependent methyltransferase [Gammaproteobacteria bacterium]